MTTQKNVCVGGYVKSGKLHSWQQFPTRPLVLNNVNKVSFVQKIFIICLESRCDNCCYSSLKDCFSCEMKNYTRAWIEKN